MMGFEDVYQLMHDDVLDDAGWQLHSTPVETEGIATATGPSTISQLTHNHASRLNTDTRSEELHTFLDPG